MTLHCAAAAELQDPSSKLSHVLRIVEGIQTTCRRRAHPEPCLHPTFRGHLTALCEQLAMRSVAAQVQPSVQRALRLLRLVSELCTSATDSEQLGWCRVSSALQTYLQQQVGQQQLQQDSASATKAVRILLDTVQQVLHSAPSTSTTTTTSTTTSSPQQHSSRMARLLQLLEAKVAGQDNPHGLRIIVLVATQRAAAEVQRALCASVPIAQLHPGLLLGQRGLYGMDPIDEQRPAMDKFKSGVGHGSMAPAKLNACPASHICCDADVMPLCCGHASSAMMYRWPWALAAACLSGGCACRHTTRTVAWCTGSLAVQCCTLSNRQHLLLPPACQARAACWWPPVWLRRASTCLPATWW